ncbi:DUF3658 domain-containing protein [Rhizobium sp. CNPSo 3968]|uniref:DUF3658 domain-containing protein n=1 Tax=Rhizobium sp. CNPSo 3968 TaxID=3021408 RepID=UPI0025504C50|nr:DUF3658 domain-containing protein [Rhizobium sp. CNPSo 3968]MDK4722772.1 DUF3658 domain-containing protein [Rhizobium sp. CNPSo 3968]
MYFPYRNQARIIGETMGSISEPYYQVGDIMLHARLMALIDEGKLIAEGDPWNIQTCQSGFCNELSKSVKVSREKKLARDKPSPTQIS